MNTDKPDIGTALIAFVWAIFGSLIVLAACVALLVSLFVRK